MVLTIEYVSYHEKNIVVQKIEYWVMSQKYLIMFFMGVIQLSYNQSLITSLGLPQGKNGKQN